MNEIDSAAHFAKRQKIARLARLMDSSIKLPIIRKRIGWDAVLGLVPVVGDVAGGLISGYIVLSAIKLGARKRAVARMIANVGLETIVGAVPIVGDLFDMAFRANERNIAILERHLGPAPGQEPATSKNKGGSAALLAIFGISSVLAGAVWASRLLASGI